MEWPDSHYLLELVMQVALLVLHDECHLQMKAAGSFALLTYLQGVGFAVWAARVAVVVGGFGRLVACLFYLCVLVNIVRYYGGKAQVFYIAYCKNLIYI